MAERGCGSSDIRQIIDEQKGSLVGSIRAYVRDQLDDWRKAPSLAFDATLKGRPNLVLNLIVVDSLFEISKDGVKAGKLGVIVPYIDLTDGELVGRKSFLAQNSVFSEIAEEQSRDRSIRDKVSPLDDNGVFLLGGHLEVLDAQTLIAELRSYEELPYRDDLSPEEIEELRGLAGSFNPLIL